MNTTPFPHYSRPLLLVFLVSAGFLLATIPFLATMLGFNSDFLAFYTGGQIILHGETAQLYNFDLHKEWQTAWVGPFQGVFRFVYLPIFTTFYLPFAALPLVLARFSWLLASLACIGLVISISKRWSQLNTPESWLAFLAFPASYSSLLVGQNSPLTLLLFSSMAWLLWRERKLAIAGVLAGCLLYKPQLLVGLILVALWYRWWPFLFSSATVAGGVLIGSFIVSPSGTMDYLFLGRMLFASATPHRANAAVYAGFQSLLPQPIAGITTIFVSGFIIIALLVAWRRAHSRNRYLNAMLWLLPLLITPYVANYDLLLLLLPLSFLVPHLRQDRWLQGIIALLWIGPIINLVIDGFLLAVWMSLALYFLCFWRVWQEQVAGNPLRQA